VLSGCIGQVGAKKTPKKGSLVKESRQEVKNLVE